VVLAQGPALTINVLKSIPFFCKRKTTNHLNKYMKTLFRVTTIAIAAAFLALIQSCQTTGTSQAASQNEALLTQSGFKTIPITTPKQQQAVSKLPQGTVSAVKHQGKTYYVYPSATNNQLYVGKQTHVNAAKKAVAAQQAQAAQQSMNPPPTMTFQGHGPHGVVAEEFDGFGPMGVNSLGDW
jgi:hypothetical protein